MASFTDSPNIPLNPYIAATPVAADLYVGRLKQEQYDQGLERAQGYLGSVYGMQVPGKFQDYMNGKISSLQGQAQTLAGGDFSQQQLVDQIGAMTGQVTRDPIVRNAITSGAAIQQKMQNIQDIQQKHPEFFNAANYQDSMKSVADWEKDPDLTHGYTDTTPYQNYYNKSPETQKWMDIYMKLPTSYTQNIENPNTGTITKVIYSGKSAEGFRQFLENNASEQWKEQTAIEGRVSSDNMDPDTWYRTQYTPWKQGEVNVIDGKIAALGLQDGKTGSTKVSADNQAQIDYLNSQKAQILKELNDPASYQAVIANKRNLAGQIYTDNQISGIAGSLGINPNPQVLYGGVDQGLIDSLNRASRMAIAQIRQQGKLTKGSALESGFLGTDEFGNPVAPGGGQYIRPIVTKDSKQSVDYDTFQQNKASLEQQIAVRYKDQFHNWANSQGYSTSQLSDPATLKSATEKWTNFMLAQHDLYNTNPNTTQVTPEMKKILDATDDQRDMVLAMQKHDNETKAKIAADLKSQGIHGFSIGGVNIGINDIVDYAMNSDISKYDSNTAAGAVHDVISAFQEGYNRPAVDPVTGKVGTAGVVGGVGNVISRLINSFPLSEQGRAQDEWNNAIGKVKDAVNKYSQDYGNSVYNEGLIVSLDNKKDAKDPENKAEFDRILSLFNGTMVDKIKNGKNSDDNKTKFGASGAIPFADATNVTYDQLTGTATLSYRTKAGGPILTNTLTIPSLIRNMDFDHTTESKMFLNGGYSDFTTKSPVPLKLQIYSKDGTVESNYTERSDGGNASYQLRTSKGIPIGGDFSSPQAAYLWAQQTALQGQQLVIKREVDNMIQNYDMKNGTGAFQNLSLDQQRSLKNDVITDVKNKMDESAVFKVNGDEADQY